jgi:hypothetical protein
MITYCMIVIWLDAQISKGPSNVWHNHVYAHMFLCDFTALLAPCTLAHALDHKHQTACMYMCMCICMCARMLMAAFVTPCKPYT